MPYESFKREFGELAPGTGVSLESLGLDGSAGLRAFVDAVGNGLFARGFISVASVREVVDSLGGWEQYLPPKSVLFGSSAFGVLLTTTGEDVWITETQYGQVIESDYSITDLFDVLATDETRDDILQYPLFKLWNEVAGPLAPTHVLCPTPALPLGGRLSVDTLSAMSLPVYLSFTAQLFGPAGGTQVEVQRRAQ